MTIQIQLQDDENWNSLKLSLKQGEFDCWIYDQWGHLNLIHKITTLLNNIDSVELIHKRISEFCVNYPSEYAIIVSGINYCFAIVDHIRSKPIFYKLENQTLRISDTPNILASYHQSYLQKLCLNEFLLSGYVAGNKTLINNIFQIPAGEYLEFDKGSCSLHQYYNFWRNDSGEVINNESYKTFNDIFLGVFDEMLRANPDKRIVLLLSGGMDSRYILSCLLQLKAKNVLLLSYGRRHFRDPYLASKLAELTPYQWKFIPYSFRNWNLVNHSNLSKLFIKNNHQFTSVPYGQEVYALCYLKEKKILNSSCIFINGDSGGLLSGSHLSGIENPYEGDFTHIVQKLFSQKFNLWNSLFMYESDKLDIMNIITSQLAKVPNYNRYYANYYDWWEWKETTAKRLITAKREFSYFGHKLFHPFWDKRIINYFQTVPLSARLNQTFYYNSYTFLTKRIRPELLNVPNTKPGVVKFGVKKIQRGVEYFTKPRWGKFSLNDLSHSRKVAKRCLNTTSFGGYPQIMSLNTGSILWELIKEYRVRR